ncbi:MAG: FAD-dependent monooxygenase [Xanthobacteraceae bacterium]|uniref:FAD-dependent monooxygenase n=1 Tax=Pseudolabrys sp. TaxID=1960880 RepID=UPI003D0F1F86
MNQQNLPIAVVGGGIGGLSAALSLLRAGFDVHVYEQARELREVGAGLVIGPNASLLLYGLGLKDAMEAAGVAPLAWRQRRWQDGQTLLLSELASRTPPEFGAPLYTTHRADILGMLAAAIPAGRLHLGHKLATLTDDGRKVTLSFENGATATASAAVGADGIHSAVRRVLYGEEHPRFTGCVAWRGMVPADKVAHLDLPKESQLWMGPGKHFVHYPVSGERLINFVCLVDRDGWTKESWTERGDIKDVLAAYDGWHPQVTSLIGAVNEIFVWGLFDREPLPRWSTGRVTLLGDACHPMLPFLAQGAAQAIEDGCVLAACLKRGGDMAAALARYESLRRPRTSKIQLIARGNKTRNHLPDGPEQRARDVRMLAGDAEWSIGATDWIYDYDAAKASEDYLGLPPETLVA